MYFLLNHKKKTILFMTHDGELLEKEVKRQLDKKLSEFSELEILIVADSDNRMFGITYDTLIKYRERRYYKSEEETRCH